MNHHTPDASLPTRQNPSVPRSVGNRSASDAAAAAGRVAGCVVGRVEGGGSIPASGADAVGSVRGVSCAATFVGIGRKLDASKVQHRSLEISRFRFMTKPLLAIHLVTMR